MTFDMDGITQTQRRWTMRIHRLESRVTELEAAAVDFIAEIDETVAKLRDQFEVREAAE